MKARSKVAGLLVCILCISAGCIMYDFRPYEEIINEEQHRSVDISYIVGHHALVLNFSNYISLPEFQYDSLEINEIVVDELRFSTNNSRLVSVTGVSYGSTNGTWYGNFSIYENLTMTNLIFHYIFSLTLWFDNDLPILFQPANVMIYFNFTIYCTYWRPPKHTIVGTLVSVNQEVWLFLGVALVLVALVIFSLKLSNR